MYYAENKADPRIFPGFHFPQRASRRAKPAFLLCGAPYSAAAKPHFHVRGRENTISVVITLSSNQTDHFSISGGCMAANSKDSSSWDEFIPSFFCLHFPK